MRLAAVLLTVTVGACHPRPAAQQAAAVPAPDSLAGFIAVTGSELDQHLVLRGGSRVTALVVPPAMSAALARVSGAEVEVRGRADATQFRVERFVVRRVDGAPVLDGVLRSDAGGLVLETATGRVPVGNPPAVLRSLVGARVWLGGSVASGPSSYGVISPAP